MLETQKYFSPFTCLFITLAQAFPAGVKPKIMGNAPIPNKQIDI